MSWTEERIARLIELDEKGYSATQIAKDLGGVSRNAVIGKLSRMKSHRPRNIDQTTKKVVKPGARKPRTISAPKVKPANKRRAPRTPPPAAVRTRSDLPDGVSLVDLNPDQCRFPLREVLSGADQRFCGAPVGVSTRPGVRANYCPHHQHITTGVGTPSERRAARLSGKHYSGTKRIGT